MCIPHIVARQRLSKHVPTAMSTHNCRRTAGCVVSYAAFVISKESLWVCLFIPLLLLGNGSVNMILQQWWTVGCTVVYAVHVISNVSRLLVLPRTPCFIFILLRIDMAVTQADFITFSHCENFRWYFKDVKVLKAVRGNTQTHRQQGDLISFL
jgi:hypothetical protein